MIKNKANKATNMHKSIQNGHKQAFQLHSLNRLSNFIDTNKASIPMKILLKLMS